MGATPPGVTAEAGKERDPFGTRHKLANVAMAAMGLEDEGKQTLARAVSFGALFVGDTLGSLLLELRQWRDELNRRPPQKIEPKK